MVQYESSLHNVLHHPAISPFARWLSDPPQAQSEPGNCSRKQILSWAKILFRFSHYTLWKNLNKLFGQPSTSQPLHSELWVSGMLCFPCAYTEI